MGIFFKWGSTVSWWYLFLFCRCLFDRENVPTRYINIGYGSFYIVIMLTTAALYTGIWRKIKRVSASLKEFKEDQVNPNMSKENKYNKAALRMSTFLAVQLLTWVSYIIYSYWMLFGEPPVVMVVLTVLFGGMGGVFNCIAYTLIQRQDKGTKKKPSFSGQVSQRSVGKKGPAPKRTVSTISSISCDADKI